MRFDFDRTKDPPAPVLPVRVGAPEGKQGAVILAILDTGADVSVIPEQLAEELGLLPVARVTIRGATGSVRRVPMYRAELDVAGATVPVNAVGVGEAALIGRDILNRWTVTLHGPEERLEVELPSSAGG